MSIILKVRSWFLATAASGFLLEMHMLRPSPDVAASDALRLGPSNLYLKVTGSIDINSGVRTKLVLKLDCTLESPGTVLKILKSGYHRQRFELYVV